MSIQLNINKKGNSDLLHTTNIQYQENYDGIYEYVTLDNNLNNVDSLFNIFYDNDNKYFVFNSNDEFIIEFSDNGDIQKDSYIKIPILIVGGGGGGGYDIGGGGGAGAVINCDLNLKLNNDIIIKTGTGGDGGLNLSKESSTQGIDSYIEHHGIKIIAYGGGKGGSSSKDAAGDYEVTDLNNGGNGGSGGGSSYLSTYTQTIKKGEKVKLDNYKYTSSLGDNDLDLRNYVYTSDGQYNSDFNEEDDFIGAGGGGAGVSDNEEYKHGRIGKRIYGFKDTQTQRHEFLLVGVGGGGGSNKPNKNGKSGSHIDGVYGTTVSAGNGGGGIQVNGYNADTYGSGGGGGGKNGNGGNGEGGIIIIKLPKKGTLSHNFGVQVQQDVKYKKKSIENRYLNNKNFLLKQLSLIYNYNIKENRDIFKYIDKIYLNNDHIDQYDYSNYLDQFYHYWVDIILNLDINENIISFESLGGENNNQCIVDNDEPCVNHSSNKIYKYISSILIKILSSILMIIGNNPNKNFVDLVDLIYFTSIINFNIDDEKLSYINYITYLTSDTYKNKFYDNDNKKLTIYISNDEYREFISGSYEQDNEDKGININIYELMNLDIEYKYLDWVKMSGAGHDESLLTVNENQLHYASDSFDKITLSLEYWDLIKISNDITFDSIIKYKSSYYKPQKKSNVYDLIKIYLKNFINVKEYNFNRHIITLYIFHKIIKIYEDFYKISEALILNSIKDQTNKVTTIDQIEKLFYSSVHELNDPYVCKNINTQFFFQINNIKKDLLKLLKLEYVNNIFIEGLKIPKSEYTHTIDNLFVTVNINRYYYILQEFGIDFDSEDKLRNYIIKNFLINIKKKTYDIINIKIFKFNSKYHIKEFTYKLDKKDNHDSEKKYDINIMIKKITQINNLYNENKNENININNKILQTKKKIDKQVEINNKYTNYYKNILNKSYIYYIIIGIVIITILLLFIVNNEYFINIGLLIIIIIIIILLIYNIYNKSSIEFFTITSVVKDDTIIHSLYNFDDYKTYKEGELLDATNLCGILDSKNKNFKKYTEYTEDEDVIELWSYILNIRNDLLELTGINLIYINKLIDTIEIEKSNRLYNDVNDVIENENTRISKIEDIFKNKTKHNINVENTLKHRINNQYNLINFIYLLLIIVIITLLLLQLFKKNNLIIYILSSILIIINVLYFSFNIYKLKRNDAFKIIW